jgi:hypothetical protein
MPEILEAVFQGQQEVPPQMEQGFRPEITDAELHRPEISFAARREDFPCGPTT